MDASDGAGRPPASGGPVTRQLAKYALCALVLAALLKAGLQRKRKSSAAQSHKEALMTWEDEGGALPS